MIGAVDIGGTKILAGMVDESSHEVLSSLEQPTPRDGDFFVALNLIISMLQETADGANQELRGIGIGCTGPVNPREGTIGDGEFLPGWEGGNLVNELTGAFEVSVALKNDVDAAVLGETLWGIGSDAHKLIYVSIGTGIGCGLVLEGQLYRGVKGTHPEIGHHVIDPSGPVCYCGASGCWESLASGRALENWMRENLQSDERESRTLVAKEICKAAELGDPFSLKATRRCGYYLGLGISNIITIFIPDVLVLGGGLMVSHKLFMEAILRVIHKTCGRVPHEKVRLIPATFGTNSGLIGAACAWIYHVGALK